jgi:hypothetical protein
MDNGNKPVFPDSSNVPYYIPSFQEIAKQMRINQKIIMKEISEHVDREIERLKKAQLDG